MELLCDQQTRRRQASWPYTTALYRNLATTAQAPRISARSMARLHRRRRADAIAAAIAAATHGTQHAAARRRRRSLSPARPASRLARRLSRTGTLLANENDDGRPLPPFTASSVSPPHARYIVSGSRSGVVIISQPPTHPLTDGNHKTATWHNEGRAMARELHKARVNGVCVLFVTRATVSTHMLSKKTESCLTHTSHTWTWRAPSNLHSLGHSRPRRGRAAAACEELRVLVQSR